MRYWLSVVAMALMAGCATHPPYDVSDPAETLSLKPLTPKAHWGTVLAEYALDGTATLRPREREGIAYLAEEQAVVARRSGDGKLLWRRELPAPVSAGVTLSKDSVLVTTRKGRLLALAMDDGRIRWQSQLSSEALAPPLIDGGLVVVQTADGKLFGLRLSDGGQVWVYARQVTRLSLRGTTTPQPHEGQVISGFSSGKIAAVSLRDGSLAWEATVSVPRGRSELERMVDIDGGFLLEEQTLYVAGYQGRVAALDLFDGRTRWTRDMSNHTGLDSVGSWLVMSDSEGSVWALNKSNGATLWRQGDLKGRGLGPVAHFAGHVYVGDYSGALYRLKPENGEIEGYLAYADVAEAGGVISRAHRLEEEAFMDRGLVRSPAVMGLWPVADGLYVIYENGALTKLMAGPTAR